MFYDFVLSPDNIDPYMLKGYESEAKRVTREEYLYKNRRLITDFFGIEYKNKPIGYVLYHSNWIHCSIDKNHHNRWFTKRMVSLVRYGLLLHGVLFTSVHKEDKDVLSFLKKLGFKEYDQHEEGHPVLIMYPEDFIFGVE